MLVCEISRLRGTVAAAFLALTVAFAGFSVEAGEWRDIGPAGGAILSIAVSPYSGDVIYVGTGSGVYKSIDSGLSWAPAGLAGERVVAVAIDPWTTTRVYAATKGVLRGAGRVYLSTDGGAAWTESSEGLQDPRDDGEYLEVNSLVVDLHDPSTVWAGTSTNFGVYKSSDAGTTWARVRFGDDTRALATHPGYAGVVFVSVGGTGLYRSVDSGDTWSYVGSEIVDYSPNGQPYHPPIVGLAVSEADPEVVYAVTSNDVLKSIDGGDGWQSFGALQGSLGYAVHNVAIATDPGDVASVYVATHYDGVFHSIDGGESWQQIGEVLECTREYADVIHRRASALEIAPSGGRLILGTEDEGLYSRLIEGGLWARSSVGLNATDVTSVTVNPRNPARLLASTRGLGVLRSVNGGMSWESATTGYGDECGPSRPMPSFLPVPDCRVLIDVTWSGDGDTVVAAGDCGVYTSGDAGVTWDRSQSSADWIDTMAVAPGDASRMYVAGWLYGMRYSPDGGASWAECDASPIDHANFRSMGVSPADSLVVMVGTTTGLYASRDGCGSWDGPTPGINAVCPDGRWTVVDAVEFEPSAAGVVYAGSSCGLFVSEDDGASWRLAGLEGLQVTAIGVGRGEIVAGTWGDGVWASGDGGSTWERISPQSSNPFINGVLVDPVAGRVYAATAGNGISVLDRWMPMPRRPNRRAPATTSARKIIAGHR